MEDITIEPLRGKDNIDLLVSISMQENYNFVKKLATGLTEGTNTFEYEHELLLCAKNREGSIIAVGGIQVDPYEHDSRIGRLRHLYVHPDYRRHNVGKKIVELLLDFAKNHFDEVRLKTPFEGYENTASKFYESNGFKRSHQEKYIHVYK